MTVSGSPRRLHVLFSGHDLKFLWPFIEYCRTQDAFDVRVLEQSGHYIDSLDQAREHLDWADVIFCEWALGNAVWFSHHKRDDQVLIVRLHAQETRARDRIDFIWRLDWSRVDKLVLITHHVYDWMLNEFEVLRDRSCLIYNPVDTKTKFSLPGKPDRRFNLGLVGMVPSLKRVDLAVRILSQLKKIDRRFTLHVKGKRPDDFPWMLSRTEEMRWYKDIFEKIEEIERETPSSVLFAPHGHDMPEWYSNIGFILSTSDSEGSHQAVAEGMAAGCVPVIRNWVGAERIYPPKFVSSSIAGMVDHIQTCLTSDTFDEESAYCRRFAHERFNQEMICEKLMSLFFQSLNDRRDLPIPEIIRTRAAQILPTVLIVAYLPVGSGGGYRIRVEQEIKELVKMGCRVHLACLLPEKPTDMAGSQSPEDDNYSARVIEHKHELEALGGRTHIVPTRDFFGIDATVRSLGRPLEQVTDIIRTAGVDIVHCEAIYCGRFGLLLKEKEGNIRLSVDWHGAGPEEERLNGAHSNRIKTMEKWERKVLVKCDLNVFVSKSMKDHFVRKYQELNTPHVIVPCCVSDERFGTTNESGEASALGIPDDRVTVAYVGSMAEWQCGREMIGLFSDLYRRDSGLFFLLLVPENDQPKALKWADEFNLPRDAFLLREVAHREVPSYLSASHTGVLLRRDDPVNRVSSPTKFGEYLSAGLPVLMTDCIGDFSEMAHEREVGLVLESALLDRDHLPSERLDEIIAFAKRSSNHRRDIGTQCREVAYTNLHWEPAVQQWVGCYRER